jgi:hypothetical protein
VYLSAAVCSFCLCHWPLFFFSILCDMQHIWTDFVRCESRNSYNSFLPSDCYFYSMLLVSNLYCEQQSSSKHSCLLCLFIRCIR